MDLYIDRNNLYSLIRAKKETDAELYAECDRLLRRHMHLIFNFDKASCRTDAALLPWLLERGTCGRGRNEESDEFRSEIFPERPVKNNFRSNRGWKLFMSMFMLDLGREESVEHINKLKNTRSMLVGGVGEEIALLQQLFCTGSFDLHSIYNIRDKNTFPGWQVLKGDGHIMPCSDIVIADRYLFGSIDKPTDEAVLNQNLYAMLQLFAEEKQDQKVNIVFFTDEISEDCRAAVKKRVEAIFGKRSGTKVTFVMFNHERPHDRFILTNYRLFRSGDSFNNYFNEKGLSQTKGLTLDVDSIANNNVCSIVCAIQDWFQGICNNNPSRIFGSKESNFINFK